MAPRLSHRLLGDCAVQAVDRSVQIAARGHDETRLLCRAHDAGSPSRARSTGRRTATSGTPCFEPDGQSGEHVRLLGREESRTAGSGTTEDSSTKRRPFWSASRATEVAFVELARLSSSTSPRRLPVRTPSWSASSSCSSVSRPARKISVPRGTPRLATSSGLGAGATGGGGAGRLRSRLRPSPDSGGRGGGMVGWSGSSAGSDASG